jgi:hypothetical protein
LEELPEDVLNNAKLLGNKKGIDGYIFTADPT